MFTQPKTWLLTWERITNFENVHFIQIKTKFTFHIKLVPHLCFWTEVQFNSRITCPVLEIPPPKKKQACRLYPNPVKLNHTVKNC
jgi:hypothetical protein